jgi:hypothetical protein
VNGNSFDDRLLDIEEASKVLHGSGEAKIDRGLPGATGLRDRHAIKFWLLRW